MGGGFWPHLCRGRRSDQASPGRRSCEGISARQGILPPLAGLAADYGWEFGNLTAGHLIGHFPHERRPADPDHLRIRHGNLVPLRELDASGDPRHWILEIHFIDRAREIGGFYEELLTVDARDADPHLAG